MLRLTGFNDKLHFLLQPFVVLDQLSDEVVADLEPEFPAPTLTLGKGIFEAGKVKTNGFEVRQWLEVNNLTFSSE